MEIGDSVRLKNRQGPKMTVTDIKNNLVFCVWFTRDELMKDAVLPKVALEVVEEAGRPKPVPPPGAQPLPPFPP